LLCRGEKPVPERLDAVADSHSARHGDGAVDAERQRLVPPVAAVLGERPERVEIGQTGLRIV
jgi:hypothetical protein